MAALLGLGCSSASIISDEPSGSGGTTGDAPTYINLDALQTIKMDGRTTTTRLGSDAPPGPNCGNSELTSDEACDDGNTLSEDGCANNCLSVEPVETRSEMASAVPMLGAISTEPDNSTIRVLPPCCSSR